MPKVEASHPHPHQSSSAVKLLLSQNSILDIRKELQHFNDKANLVSFDSYLTLVRLFEAGKLDAIVAGDVVLHEVIQRAGPEHAYHLLKVPVEPLKFWSLVGSGQKQLLRKIRRGLFRIVDWERSGVVAQWIQATFSAESRLVLGIDPDLYPLSFFNVMGKPSGLFVDIWRLWSEKTGRPIRFVSGSTVENLENLRNGKIDVIAALTPTEQRQQYLAFSEPYYRLKTRMYYRAGSLVDPATDLFGKRIGTLIASSEHEFVDKQLPGSISVTYDTLLPMIEGLINGEIDALISEFGVAEAEISRLQLNGVIVLSDQLVLNEQVAAAGVRR